MLRGFVIVSILAVCNAELASIVPFQSRPKHLIAPLALTGPSENCGVAQVTDIRVSGCSSTPCQINRGTTYDVEVDFISRDWHADMRLRSVLRQVSQLQVIHNDERIEDSTLNPGQAYTMRFSFVASAGFSGASELRFKMYQNYTSEVCWVVPININ